MPLKMMMKNLYYNIKKDSYFKGSFIFKSFYDPKIEEKGKEEGKH